jgi:hypothetical protein
MAKSKAPAAAAAKDGNGDNKPIRNLYLVGKDSKRGVSLQFT